MALKLYRPRRAARTPVVNVGGGGFNFSAEASRKAGLESAHWVRLHTDEEERCIAFEFLDDSIQPEDANKLMRGRGSARSCRAKALINGIPWIKAVAGRNRKFKMRPHPVGRGLWAIWLAPWFELSARPEAIGEIGAAAGIYRYRDASGEVIYIGKGCVADRYREPERREWGIAKIEYSLVPDEEQYEWEKYHLNDFAKEHDGRKPRFNKVAGHL